MVWNKAPDISIRIRYLITHLPFKNIASDRVFCFRSLGSSSRAYARIWSLPKIWQQALDITPGYCVEVISEKFDRLDPPRQEKILIHELLHIPSSFSGSLSPHRTRNHRTFRQYSNNVDDLFNQLDKKSYEV